MVNLVGRIYQNARVLRERETKRDGDLRHFQASESGDCKRQIALRKLNTVRETEDDPIGLLRLEDGHMHGSAVRHLVARLPGVHVTDVERDEIIFAELSGCPPIIITGHCDFIIHDLEEGARIIVEVKGLNRFSFGALKNEDLETLKTYYKKAIPQSRIYRYMHGADYSIVLVKCKDTSEYKQFTIPKDEAKEYKIMERLSQIAKELLEGKVPECDYLKGDKKNCKYCPYPSMCGR